MWIMSPRKIKEQTVGGQVQDAKHNFQQNYYDFVIKIYSFV